MKIFLDMDGVLTDWSGKVCEILNIDKTEPEAQRILKSEIFLHGWKFGTNEEVDKAVLDAGYDFWYELELLPWAHRLYQLCQKYGEVFFLTSPGKFHAGAHAKLDYLKHHFGATNYILTKHKYFAAAPDHILIDDMLKNIVEWEKHGGKPWHWPNQYHLIDDPEFLEKEFVALEETLRQMVEKEKFVQDNPWLQ